MEKFYVLPKLNYGYGELAPHVSEAQLRLHHEKHHNAYVVGANAALEKIDKARKDKTELDAKSALKNFSFHLSGRVLHDLFFENLAPPNKGGKFSGKIAEAINKEFGSFERFKQEFSAAANSVEGGGWAALTYCKRTDRILIMQIEKHNVNAFTGFKLLLVLDVWEHAYYLDYKNDRAKYVEAFWNILNWNKVNERFEKLLK